jgi:hypothetical protein
MELIVGNIYTREEIDQFKDKYGTKISSFGHDINLNWFYRFKIENKEYYFSVKDDKYLLISDGTQKLNDENTYETIGIHRPDKRKSPSYYKRDNFKNPYA